jgi:hypothetical protein
LSPDDGGHILHDPEGPFQIEFPKILLAQHGTGMAGVIGLPVTGLRRSVCALPINTCVRSGSRNPVSILTISSCWLISDV